MLYAPETTPLDMRVKALYAGRKYDDVLELVWTKWKQASHDSKRLFAQSLKRRPRWPLVAAESLAAKQGDATTRALCWLAIARGWKRLSDATKFQQSFEKCLDECAAVKPNGASVRLRLFVLESLVQSLSRTQLQTAADDTVKNGLDAIPLARSARTLDSSSAFRHDVYLQLGALCYQQGNTALADNYLKRATQHVPTLVSTSPFHDSTTAAGL